jgi:hypothetical protein
MAVTPAPLAPRSLRGMRVDVFSHTLAEKTAKGKQKEKDPFFLLAAKKPVTSPPSF